MLLILALLSFLSWLYLLFLRGDFWRLGPQLPPASSLENWPPVAAVVPARDESAVIERTLSSLRRLDYPGRFFIVLIDDGSRDGTAALAAKIAAGRGHAVDIVSGKPLPAGWTGKVWAMAQGLEHIPPILPEARYVWFTDADLEHDPQALRDLVWQAESRSLDLVSNMAVLHCTSFWERLLIPAFVFFFRKLYPFQQVNSPRHSVSAAAGGSMLVRLETLRRSGGLERIRGELIDDCALARLLKTCGNIWLGLAVHSRSIRPYSFADIWRMVARSAYTQLRCSPFWLVTAVCSMVLVYLIPIIAVTAGCLSGSYLTAALGGMAWILMFAAYRPMVSFYRKPHWTALLLPAAALLYTLMTIDSARQHWQGQGGAWKGRVQPTKRA